MNECDNLSPFFNIVFNGQLKNILKKLTLTAV